MATPNPVPKLYHSVIEDVVSNVREAFLDDGVDEQVLQELKQLWENKLSLSKAVDIMPEDAKIGGYEQHHLMRQQQPPIPPSSRIQQHPKPTARVATQPRQVPQTVPATQQQAQQMPMFNQSTGQLEISGAAAQAQSALGLFPGGTVTLQTPNGPMQFIIQAPAAGQQPSASNTQVRNAAAGSAVSVPGGLTMPKGLGQLDGNQDSSSDDSDEDRDDANDDDDNNEEEDDQGHEEEPLCSDDDVSDTDPTELFESENVVVCQFDKINRAKNKWKFYLKDGIMNVNGKDYIFQKCNGEADW